MTFPSKLTLSEMLRNVKDTTRQVRALALSSRNTLTAGNVGGNSFIDLHASLTLSKNLFNDAAGNADLVQFAKDQFSDQTFDIVTEFTTMIAALSDVLTEIETTFPTGPGSWLQKDQWDSVNGGTTIRSFTPAQTTNLQSLLTTLAATIN